MIKRIVLAGLGGLSLFAATAMAGSTTFSGTVNLTDFQTSDYFVYSVSDGVNTVSGATSLGASGVIPNSGSLPFTFTLPETIVSGYGTVMGLYIPNGQETPAGVSVVFPSATHDSLISGSTTWAAEFPGTTESSIMTALGLGSASTLEAFVNANSADFVHFTGSTTGLSAGAVLFSTAANGGSFSLNVNNNLSATPEPSSFLMLAIGLCAAFVPVRRAISARK